MFVDGRWTPSLSGETFTADSPATGQTIGEVPQGAREDAQLAIGAANRAADTWSRATVFERAALMHRVGDVIESRREELAHTLTLDQGKPLHESRDEVEELIAYWRNAAEDGKRLEGRLANSFTAGKRVMLVRRPRGVIGVITPWNWPYTMPAELIAPALASGNTVVWTPASTTAVAGIALARGNGEADPPPGGFNHVTGPRSAGGGRDRARAVHRRGRPAAGCVQPRHRPRFDRRRRDRAESGHARRRLHRLDRDRPSRRGGGCGQGRRARARGQRPGRRARRRRPRARRRGDGHRLLPLR